MRDTDPISSAIKDALESLQTETNSQMEYHQQLAKNIRKEIEQPTTVLLQRQARHNALQKRVERELKMKKTQEKRVEVLRAKYEQECLKIHSSTVTASETNPSDPERDINHELAQALQEVQITESEFRSHASVLSEIVSNWEDNWKVFCDSCQEMEEERIECVKDVTWAYANVISTACVEDDQVSSRLQLQDPSHRCVVVLREGSRFFG